MTNIIKDTLIRVIVVNIADKHNSFVENDFTTSEDYLNTALQCYMDFTKYRIITV